MAMRMSGLISGMDTESVIQDLVAARRTKVTKQVKAKTKLEWKQDAWKELNTKLRNFQSKYASTLRFSDAYSKKTTSVSNPSVASVITGEKAVDSVQTLKVKQLAKTGYLTGADIKKLNGSSEDYTALTKLSDIFGFDPVEETPADPVDPSVDPVDPADPPVDPVDPPADGDETPTAPAAPKHTITLTIGKGADAKQTEITFDRDSTISDVMTQLKNAGLNASFDESNQRLFISSKQSGENYDFTFTSDDATANSMLGALGLTEAAGATRVEGQDAIIELNKAEFKSSSNVFSINGLTITANAETKDGELVTLTTSQDTSGIYDMLRNFISDYNKLINEMDKLYNADAAKGYEPLTDEEKAEMSDSEIEKWEKTVKDALLRRDDSLYTVSNALTSVMSMGFKVGKGTENEKTLYLTNFGIGTLGYFDSADNEKNALHIDGDDKDPDTSGKADKLKALIGSDPDTVIDFFSQLSNELYTKMNKLSSSVEGTRSFGKFYDDKLMKTQFDDYTSKIADLEDKLADYEDKWYKKFAAMETALAKLQSNTNALTNMLG